MLRLRFQDCRFGGLLRLEFLDHGLGRSQVFLKLALTHFDFGKFLFQRIVHRLRLLQFRFQPCCLLLEMIVRSFEGGDSLLELLRCGVTLLGHGCLRLLETLWSRYRLEDFKFFPDGLLSKGPFFVQYLGLVLEPRLCFFEPCLVSLLKFLHRQHL